MDKYYLKGTKSEVTLVARFKDECWIKNQSGTNSVRNITELDVLEHMELRNVPFGRRFVHSSRECIKVNTTGWNNNNLPFTVDLNTFYIVPSENYRLYHCSALPHILVEVLSESK